MWPSLRNNMEDYSHYDIRPDVINYDDLRKMVPALEGHPRIADRLIRLLWIDKVNRAHAAICDTPGATFAGRLLFEQFKMKIEVSGKHVLDHLPEGAFITVSNHPFGAIDGIILIHLIGERRPNFKVMVNMILNYISAMRPNFIAVDQSASSDPAKRAVSVAGIRTVLRQLKEGEPIGFFPAGAMSKTTLRHGLQDRPWQDSVLQLIFKAKVPVIPIYFHGRNTRLCNIMGHVCWPLRSLMIPSEMFKKSGKTVRVSVGDPVSVEQQAQFKTPAELGAFLRDKTYDLRSASFEGDDVLVEDNYMKLS